MISESKPNRKRARKLASKLLRETGANKPPVLLAPVVKMLDITIDVKLRKSPLPEGLAGFLDREDKIISYNAADPIVRQRFTVAHEIGHYVLGHYIECDIFDLSSKDPREVEANMFAAELLIPLKWIKDDLVSGDADIKMLSKRYWVSEVSMGWRLSNSDSLLLK